MLAGTAPVAPRNPRRRGKDDATVSRTASLLAGTLVGALALTGCGAGQIAGTAEQLSAVSGSNVGAGPIVVRDAVIEFGEEVEGGAVYPRGADAPLSMTIVNEGPDADRLVSVTSAWASEVTVSGVTEIPGGRAVVVEGEAPAPVAAPTTGARPSGAPSAAPTTAAAPTPAGEAEGTQVVLTGLLDDIRAGLTYDVVLTFERAGEITVPVPVGSTDEPREDEPAE
jgi:copper(I)-binding protein